MKAIISFVDNQNRLSAPLYSPIQWWNQFEIIQSVLKTLSDYEQILERDDLPVYVYQASRSSLSPSINKKAKIEIATTVNAMEAFVKATYKLEGDNPLSFEAYQQLSILFASVYPALPKRKG